MTQKSALVIVVGTALFLLQIRNNPAGSLQLREGSLEIQQLQKEILRLQSENEKLRRGILDSTPNGTKEEDNHLRIGSTPVETLPEVKKPKLSFDKEILRLQTELEELRRHHVALNGEVHAHLDGNTKGTPAITSPESVRSEEASSPESNGESIKKQRLVFDNCTALQKEVVFNQTTSKKRHQSAMEHLTSLTSCPDSTKWLEEFYHQSQKHDDSNFLAVNIGCNKGYDSLNLLRMGTRQESIMKKPWKEAAFANASRAVCGASEKDHPLPPSSVPRQGDVFCVEPMPATIQALQKASEATNMEEKGLHIVHAAVSNEIGTAQFPVVVVGKEDYGLGEKKDPSKHQYQDVPLMTLDEFGKRHMTNHSNQNINVLLIDTEGFDFEVMKGAGEMLQRVEYLEFEFHNMGNWKKSHLKEAIDMLDDKGFTCHWAGQQKLWRITGCWQDHFGFHTWSNVACVNNELKPDLAQKMEQVFLQTIHQG